VEYTAATKIGNSTVISATFTPDETSAFRQQALQAKARSLRVPGFRPGKAPLGMVASYVSNDDLKDEVVQKAASQAYLAFLKDQSDADALIFEPEIVSSTVGEELNDELKLEVRVFELPKTDQAFWNGIEVEDEPVDVTKAVERRISALVEALTETSPKEGAAGTGDAVTVTIKTEKSTNPYHTELTVGEGEVGKAYEPYLVGMLPGETRHFSVQLSGSSMEGDITLESVAESTSRQWTMTLRGAWAPLRLWRNFGRRLKMMNGAKPKRLAKTHCSRVPSTRRREAWHRLSWVRPP